MSDLMVDFGTVPAREVRARPYVYQQAVVSATLPIHANMSISVETSAPRPAPFQQPAAGSAPQQPIPQQQPSPQLPPQWQPPQQQVPQQQPPQQQPQQPQPVRGGTNFNVHQRPAMVHVVPGLPQFQFSGRLPSMQPTVFMDIRPPTWPPQPAQSPPEGQQQQQQPSQQAPPEHQRRFGIFEARQPDEHPSMSFGPIHPQGFDDFLPCHSRHVSRSRQQQSGAQRAAGSTPDAGTARRNSDPSPLMGGANARFPMFNLASFTQGIMAQVTHEYYFH